MTKELITMNPKELQRLEMIKKMIEGSLSQKAAALQLALSVRQVRRLCERYETQGVSGLISKHRGKKGVHVLSKKLKLKVVKLAGTIYTGFGPTFMSEKLWEREKLKISRESLRQLLILENLWKPKKEKIYTIHQQRKRRPSLGELVQIDGSPHDWFEGRAPKCCLIVFIDDASSELLYLRFEPVETTQAYFRGLFFVIQNYGLPLGLYSDKHGIFRVNLGDDLTAQTQFGRACEALDIELINAHSPQAKGRVERANLTCQDRLTKELRLANISDLETANQFLEKNYRPNHNKKFAKLPQDSKKSFIVNTYPEATLKHILSEQVIRKVSKNLELRFENKIYQIKSETKGRRLQQANIAVCRTITNEIILLYQGKILNYQVFEPNQRRPMIVDEKSLNELCDQKFTTRKAVKPPASHPWRRTFLSKKSALMQEQKFYDQLPGIGAPPQTPGYL